MLKLLYVTTRQAVLGTSLEEIYNRERRRERGEGRESKKGGEGEERERGRERGIEKWRDS